MTKIAAFVSKTNLDWLIPINELKTLDKGICDVLNFERMTQDDEFTGDVLYVWSEGIADNRKHCVAPLVHVLVSERLTAAALRSYQTNPGAVLPAVFTMQSSFRSMDWVIVLHLNAYKRPQEFAFTESRGLLKVNADSPVYKHWVADNASMQWLGDTVSPNYCYGLFTEYPFPATLGDGADKDLTVEVARNGCIVREYMADYVRLQAAGDPKRLQNMHSAADIPSHWGLPLELVKNLSAKSVAALDNFGATIYVRDGEVVSIVDGGGSTFSPENDFYMEVARVVQANWDEATSMEPISGASEPGTGAVKRVLSDLMSAGCSKVLDLDPNERYHQRLIRVAPGDDCDVTRSVIQSSGRNVMPIIRTAKEYGLTVAFSQVGDLVQVSNSAGELLSMELGPGHVLAEMSNNLTLSSLTSAATPKVVGINPVGTKLKSEFFDLSRFIRDNRPKPGMADIPTQTRFGNKEAYHYPPYCTPIADTLRNANVLTWAIETGLVLITLNDDFSQLVAVCDSNGEEISTSRGMGNDVALAFGGVIGRQIQQ